MTTLPKDFDALVEDHWDGDVPLALRRALKERRREFPDDLAMKLMAIAMMPEARASLNAEFDRAWKKAKKVPSFVDEVVVGGGVHGSVYAAARTALGFPAPLVLERIRPGGPFAGAAWFDMNSRNRPGNGGVPSENAALNYVPGAPIQASMLSHGEYSTNADLAFVVRCSLAKHADLRMVDVERIEDDEASDLLIVVPQSGDCIIANRVIDARGLGEPLGKEADGKRILNFSHFAERMGTPFPLRGLGRVAVVGGGDTGKVVVEALLGIGPSAGMSVAGLDFVEQVDWFAKDLPVSCNNWRDEVRGRYQAIGSFLRPLDNGKTRLRVFGVAGTVQPSLDGVLVNGRAYDHVIVATGWEKPRGLYGGTAAVFGTPSLALKDKGAEVYLVGPRANLPFDESERNASYSSLDDNKVAIFRLVQKTAALAASLPGFAQIERLRARVQGVAPKAIQERKVLGKDKNGKTVREGDRLRSPTFGFTGVASGFTNDYFLIQRDDGVKGGGPNGEYGSYPRNVEVIALEQPKEGSVALAKDKNGNPIYVEDRVRYGKGRGPTGTAVKSDEKQQPVNIKRDDGVVGTGPEGAYHFGMGSEKNMEVLPFEEATPERKEVGKDVDGKPILLGSRVEFREVGGKVQVTGTVVEGTAVFPYSIKRDDGKNGGAGSEGTWAATAGVRRTVRLLDERKPLGQDKNGKDVFEGDRVTVKLPNSGETFGGVTERVSAPDDYFMIRTTGGEPRGAYPRFVTKESPVGKTGDGKDLYVGDRVTFDDGGREGVEGTVVSRPTSLKSSGMVYAVRRDDNLQGAGPDGTWGIFETPDSVLSSVRKIPQA